MPTLRYELLVEPRGARRDLERRAAERVRQQLRLDLSLVACETVRLPGVGEARVRELRPLASRHSVFLFVAPHSAARAAGGVAQGVRRGTVAAEAGGRGREAVSEACVIELLGAAASVALVRPHVLALAEPAPRPPGPLACMLAVQGWFCGEPSGHE